MDFANLFFGSCFSFRDVPYYHGRRLSYPMAAHAANLAVARVVALAAKAVGYRT